MKDTNGEEFDNLYTERARRLDGVENLYTLVNLCGIQSNRRGMYSVIGEDASTYGELDDAAYALLDIIEEYDHTIYSAPIFKLVPVPYGEVEKAIERVRPQWDEDNEWRKDEENE